METTIIKSIDGFQIENLHPQIATIYPQNKTEEYKKGLIVLDFGQKKKGDLTTVQLKVTKLNITGVSASCGCTIPTYQVLDNGDTIVNIVYDSNLINGYVSKYVNLLIDNRKEEIKINLIINKQ